MNMRLARLPVESATSGGCEAAEGTAYRPPAPNGLRSLDSADGDMLAGNGSEPAVVPQVGADRGRTIENSRSGRYPSQWAGVMEVDATGGLDYRLVMAVDVERYSFRTAQEQFRVQCDLGRALDTTADRCTLDRGTWYRQVNGDGELAVLPADTDVAHVVGAFVGRLHDVLLELNRTRPDTSRLRLRLVFHYGTLAAGPFGPVGEAPIVVCRLLDADPLRRRLAAQRRSDVALAVSDSLFTDVIRTGFCGLDPARFEAMQITTKGTVYRGHVYRHAESPRRLDHYVHKNPGFLSGRVAKHVPDLGQLFQRSTG